MQMIMANCFLERSSKTKYNIVKLAGFFCWKGLPVLKSDNTQTQMLAWCVNLKKLDEIEHDALMCYLEKTPNYELVNSYEWLYKNT